MFLFAAFPERRFCIPAPESHRSVAALISSRSHIPFGRLFSCQGSRRAFMCPHLSSSNEKNKTGERFFFHFSSSNGFPILYEGFCFLPFHFFIGTKKIEIADLFSGFYKSFTFTSLHFFNGHFFEAVYQTFLPNTKIPSKRKPEGTRNTV